MNGWVVVGALAAVVGVAAVVARDLRVIVTGTGVPVLVRVNR